MYLLTVKKFLYVLKGKINNNPTEKQLSLARYLSGNHLALDIALYY